MGQLSDEDFLTLNKQCSEDIADAENQIHELEYQLYSKEEFRQHMDNIRSTLEAARRDAATGMITNEFVDKYIDKILVKSVSDDTANLQIKIFTGKTCEKYLRKLEKCATTSDSEKSVPAGHMSKKMIQSYESNMKG